MPMDKIEIVTLIELPKPTAEALASAFVLHDLSGSSEARSAVLAAHGKAIRAVVTGTGGRVDTALLTELPAVEIVSCFTAGMDSVDFAATSARGLKVTNNSAALASSVAELAMALVLSVARGIPHAVDHVRQGGWWDTRRWFRGELIGARRMGIVGLGSIGSAVARMAGGFGCEIGYHGRSARPGVPHRYFADLHEMADWAGILVLACPGNAETHHLVDAGVLHRLGPEGWLINVARGSVVDQQALIAALEAGALGRAGLDVIDGEPAVPPQLLAMPDRVVVTPHQGSSTADALRIRTENLIATLKAQFAAGIAA